MARQPMLLPLYPPRAHKTRTPLYHTYEASDLFFVALFARLVRLTALVVLSLLLPVKWTEEAGSEKRQKAESNPGNGADNDAQPSLFPSISNVSMEDEKRSKSQPQPCSTGLTTRLLPFKNESGEIEWAFTDDMAPGSELDMFKMEHPAVDADSKRGNMLSPVTLNSSNNDSLHSHEKGLSDLKHETPLSGASASSAELTPMSGNAEDEGLLEGSDEDLEKGHQCPHCDAVFKIRGYLTRHLKKHATKKAYSCPFHKFSIYIDENKITHKCHPNGGFSRRDTYKTHLKSRHFKYPEGTKTKERATSLGQCSMCGEFFKNSETWCEIHVEGGECRYLPQGFKGKLRIKNRLKKQMSEQRKAQLRKSDAQKVIEADYGSPFDTPHSMNSNTPAAAAMHTPAPINTNFKGYEANEATPAGPLLINTSSSSPTLSASSGVHPLQQQQQLQAANTASPHYSHRPVAHQQVQRLQQAEFHQRLPVPRPSQFQQPAPLIQQSIQQQQNIPMFDQFSHSNHFAAASAGPQFGEDYDDDFCLDVDQLNTPTMDVLLKYLKMEHAKDSSQSPFAPPQQAPPQLEPVHMDLYNDMMHQQANFSHGL